MIQALDSSSDSSAAVLQVTAEVGVKGTDINAAGAGGRLSMNLPINTVESPPCSPLGT